MAASLPLPTGNARSQSEPAASSYHNARSPAARTSWGAVESARAVAVQPAWASTAPAAPSFMTCRRVRSGMSLPCPSPCAASCSLEGPLLVGSAGAGPQLRQCAVGRRVAAHVQAESRLGAGDRAVRVQVPLLVAAAVAGPDDRRGAVGGPVAGGVEAPSGGSGVDAELTGGRVGPLLVGA